VLGDPTNGVMDEYVMSGRGSMVLGNWASGQNCNRARSDPKMHIAAPQLGRLVVSNRLLPCFVNLLIGVVCPEAIGEAYHSRMVPGVTSALVSCLMISGERL
jgi:hypothetical protein